MSTTSVSESVRLFILDKSSLHIIASDLDVRDHCWEVLDNVKSYNTIKGFVTINIMLTIVKSTDVI
jgi:hypothetical protein